MVKKLRKAAPAAPKKPMKKAAAPVMKGKPLSKGKSLKKKTADRTSGPQSHKAKPLKTVEKGPSPLEVAREQAKRSTGPVPVIPKNFKWKGKSDPRKKKCILVPLNKVPSSFPKPHARIAPNTYYRIDPKQNEYKTMVTILPRGTHVAWWTCGVCTNLTTRCVCKQGFIHPKGIEHMIIRDSLDKEGVHPSSERLTIDHHDFVAHAFHWYVRKETGRISSSIERDTEWYRRRKAEQQERLPNLHPAPARPSERRTKRLSKVSKPLAKAQPVRKPLKKAVGPAVDVSDISMDKINNSAEAMAEAMTKRMTKSLKKKGAK